MSAKRCQLDESSVYLAALPVAHNFPLCCPGLLGTFDIGGKVVLAPTTSPDDILTAITEEKVTITALHLGKKEQLEYGVLEVKVPCLLALRLVYTRYHKEENYVCINTWRFS